MHAPTVSVLFKLCTSEVCGDLLDLKVLQVSIRPTRCLLIWFGHIPLRTTLH